MKKTKNATVLLHFTQKVVAAWMGVTEQRVRQLRDAGMI